LDFLFQAFVVGGECNRGTGQLSFPTHTGQPLEQTATALRMVPTDLLYFHCFVRLGLWRISSFVPSLVWRGSSSLIIILWCALILIPTSSGRRGEGGGNIEEVPIDAF